MGARANPLSLCIFLTVNRILYGNNKDGTDVSIKYTFKKQVVDDYLYATLSSVEVSEK